MLDGIVGRLVFSPGSTTIAAGYRGYSGGSGVLLWNLAARRRLGETNATPSGRRSTQTTTRYYRHGLQNTAFLRNFWRRYENACNLSL
jgi:hypothetical protein